MNFVLLSGNSVHAKEWIYNLGDVVISKFGNVYIHSYKHWDTNENTIDSDIELNSLNEKLINYSPYIFIAKSAGCILALKSIISKDIPKPTACLFLGLPLEFAGQFNISLVDLFINIDIPIIIAQNENDPFGSYNNVKSMIDSLNNTNISVKKLDGDTHDYNDFAEINKLLSDLM
jgi:predicted alpha/beta-hydrolase family hydrolase